MAIADGEVAVAQFDIVAGARVIAYMGYLARQHCVYGGGKSVQIDPFRRKNVTHFVEIRLTLGDEIKMTPVGVLRRGFFI